MYDTLSEAIAAYDDMLDEMHDIELAGISGVRGSQVLREFDPIGYRVTFFEWADAEGIDTDGLEDDSDLP